MSLMYKLFWEKPSSENLHSAGIDNILFPQGWSYEPNLKRIIEPHEAIPIFYEITNTQYMKEVMGQFSPYEVIFHPKTYQEDFKGKHYLFKTHIKKYNFGQSDKNFINDVIWVNNEVFSINKLYKVMTNLKFIEATVKRLRAAKPMLDEDFWECLFECKLLPNSWNMSYADMVEKTKEARSNYLESTSPREWRYFPFKG